MGWDGTEWERMGDREMGCERIRWEKMVMDGIGWDSMEEKIKQRILAYLLASSSSQSPSSSSLESSGATYNTSSVISPCTLDKILTASLCLASCKSVPLTARIASPTYKPPDLAAGIPSWISDTRIGTPCSLPPWTQTSI